MRPLQTVQTFTLLVQPASSQSGRNQALDFTKGSLVLFMVLYHWLNYFVTLDWDVYRYLRFITPSFILITGFLISNVYLAKHSSMDRRLHRRLFERGAKLLLLFTALNLCVNLAMSSGANGANRLLLTNAYGIYVTGNGRAAFDVLVPISYFLLLSPVLLIASSVSRLALPAMATFGLVVGIITSAAGVGSMNLELVAVAILGMTIGILPLDRINAALHRPAVLVLAYALYVAAITKWDVLFPLQVVGVCLSLLLIYFLGVKSAGDGILPRRVIELGKYSLFAYILHICVLQLLRRGLRDTDLSGVGLLIPFGATLVVTVVAVEVLALARGRSNAVDRIYRVVFA